MAGCVYETSEVSDPEWRVTKRKLPWPPIVCTLVVLFHIQVNASSLAIQVGAEGIKGNAQAVPMQTVLEKVAQEAGYVIYLDEKLKEAPVTFHIDEYLQPEKAIRSMVHPHSYAIVFGNGPEGKPLNILEVKVYSEGGKDKARFVTLKASKTDIPAKNNAKGEKAVSASSEGITVSHANSSLGEKGRSIQGGNIIRKNFYAKKTAFGPSIPEVRDSSKGPDFRPSSLQLRKTFSQYQADKQAEQQRAENQTYLQTKMRYEQERNRYRQQRNQELKEYTMNLKRNTDLNQNKNEGEKYE